MTTQYKICFGDDEKSLINSNPESGNNDLDATKWIIPILKLLFLFFIIYIFFNYFNFIFILYLLYLFKLFLRNCCLLFKLIINLSQKLLF